MSIMEREIRLSMNQPDRGLTLDDVAHLAAEDDLRRYELDKGNLLVMPPADTEHAAIIMRLGAWFLAHGFLPERVLATPGLRLNDNSGRSPDVLVLRESPTSRTVWVEPGDVLLVVEIVSPGSEKLDRLIKPVEYAQAGIGRYWRVERDPGPATVHRHRLGADERGEPAYVGDGTVRLTDLLAGEPDHIG